MTEPLIMRVFDFETTGMAPPAEVIEVGFCDYDRTAGKVLTGDSYLCGAEVVPPETRMVHHIRASDLRCATGGLLPAFDAEKLVTAALARPAVALVAHKADFEGQWVQRAAEGNIPLLCSYKAALRIWPEAPSHSVFGLLYWLEDQGKVAPIAERITPSHRALPDAYATAWVLKALYDAGMTGPQLSAWSRQPALMPRCPIGEHRGKPWADVPHGFLSWMVQNATMEEDLKYNAAIELDRRSGR